MHPSSTRRGRTRPGAPATKSLLLGLWASACSPFSLTGTTPEQGERDATAATVSARFSGLVDPSTVDPGRLTVHSGSAAIPGTVSVEGAEVIWQGELRPCQAYLVRVSAGVGDRGGALLAEDYYWAFTQKGDDCTPAVTTASPAGGGFRSGQRVTLDCRDGAGGACRRIAYTRDGTTPSFSPPIGTIVAGPAAAINVGPGETRLRYRSEDDAGNVEPVREAPFTIAPEGLLYVGTMAGLYRGIGPHPAAYLPAPTSRLVPRGVLFDATTRVLYAAGSDGLYRSHDGGMTWLRSTVLDGLGSDQVGAVYALGGIVYAATTGGLAVSVDGGDTFVNRSVADGLGSDIVFRLHALGALIYAATDGGLSISRDGGRTFVNRTMADGLPMDLVGDVSGDGATVCAATAAGLAVSTDGGRSFAVRTTADGLGDDLVTGVYCEGERVYAATPRGVSLSRDRGVSFDNRGTAHGFSDYVTRDVHEYRGTLYVMTTVGLYVSTDGGATFTTRTTAQGLGSDLVRGVYETDSALYVATSIDLVQNAMLRPGVAISTDGGRSFTHHGSAAGLGGAQVNGIASDGPMLYAAAGGFNGNLFVPGGLFLSADGGHSFDVRTTADGLPSAYISSVAVQGSRVYVGSDQGLGVSTDGGRTFAIRTRADGLGGDSVSKVVAAGADLYVATSGGLSISSDGGISFVNRTAADGLGSEYVRDIHLDGSILRVATSRGVSGPGGVSTSTDGGATFSNIVVPFAGRSDRSHVNGIHASLGVVYAATDDGLAVSRDGGVSYAFAAAPSPRTCVYGFLPFLYGCRANYDSTLFVSSDEGASFRQEPVGTKGRGVNTILFLP